MKRLIALTLSVCVTTTVNAQVRSTSQDAVVTVAIQALRDSLVEEAHRNDVFVHTAKDHLPTKASTTHKSVQAAEAATAANRLGLRAGDMRSVFTCANEICQLTGAPAVITPRQVLLTSDSAEVVISILTPGRAAVGEEHYDQKIRPHSVTYLIRMNLTGVQWTVSGMKVIGAS